jgi:uroporphyrinogen decarboxylase
VSDQHGGADPHDPAGIVEGEVRRVIAEGRSADAHVLNLGHGVLPETDPDVLSRVVELAHSQ